MHPFFLIVKNKKPRNKFSVFFRTKYTNSKAYRNLSADFTRSSSFLIALFAKTTSNTTIIGKNIPIPFSEIEISPGKVRDT